MEEAKQIVREALKRRVVSQITEYLMPQEIYGLITRTEHLYKTQQSFYATRDRAFMSMCYVSGGRISEVVGGGAYRRVDEKTVEQIGYHDGLLAQNVILKREGFLLIKGMRIVKRSQRLIKKYGASVTVRDDFLIPLKKGLFRNPAWNQLIPFGWLIFEWIGRHAVKEGRFFGELDRRQAWAIVREVTGWYPHWLRSQSEHFYGNFLLSDSVLLSSFVGVVVPAQVKRYIGYDYRAHLDVELDSTWVDEAVNEIRERIHKLSGVRSG